MACKVWVKVGHFPNWASHLGNSSHVKTASPPSAPGHKGPLDKMFSGEGKAPPSAEAYRSCSGSWFNFHPQVKPPRLAGA